MTRTIRQTIVGFVCLLMGIGYVVGFGAEVPMNAFPGASGFGKGSRGGRAGRIIFVTNLEDSGPGSLRECTESEGPRNCVFRIGGIIELKKPIIVKKDNDSLSILGQTAPGDGILLTINSKDDTAKLTPFLIKNTHDIIVRHLRVRPQVSNTIRNVDAFTVENSKQIYLDHVSGSWATDENFNAHSDTTNLTVAYSIFGEGLNKHSKCALLGSDPSGPQNITFWRNACVSNRDRNPDDNHFGGSCIEITNNIFFNALSEWGEVFSQYPGGTPIIYSENFFKAGASTKDETFAINWNPINSVAKPKIYVHNNKVASPKSKSLVLIAPDTEPYIVSTPPCSQSAPEIGSADAAYEEVRTRSGAFPRDAVDNRFIEEIGLPSVFGRGSMVTTPGQLPTMKSANPYIDEDGDGMADVMEASVGAIVGKADPWIDGDNNGWSNFDDFMQLLSDERIAGRYSK